MPSSKTSFLKCSWTHQISLTIPSMPTFCICSATTPPFRALLMHLPLQLLARNLLLRPLLLQPMLPLHSHSKCLLQRPLPLRLLLECHARASRASRASSLTTSSSSSPAPAPVNQTVLHGQYESNGIQCSLCTKICRPNHTTGNCTSGLPSQEHLACLLATHSWPSTQPGPVGLDPLHPRTPQLLLKCRPGKREMDVYAMYCDFRHKRDIHKLYCDFRH